MDFHERGRFPKDDGRLMPGFHDIFAAVPQGESPFDGPLPAVPTQGDNSTSRHDLFQGGMNVLGMVPGLGGLSSLYNAGQGAVQGFDKGQYGNTDTSYQMGGGDNGSFQAPQPSSHDSLFGSQRAGNLLYGTGISGWLGNILGQIAGGISTIGDSKIDVSPDIPTSQMLAPMGAPSPDFGPQQQMVHANPISTDMGPIATPTLPDLSQPDQGAAPGAVSDSGSSGGGGFVPQYGDQNSFGIPSFLDTFMTGAGWGGSGSWGGGSGWYGPSGS